MNVRSDCAASIASSTSACTMQSRSSNIWLRFASAFAFVLSLLHFAEFGSACTYCGCCRVEPYDDPISPYLTEINPIEAGIYEANQSAPMFGGTANAVIPIDPGSWSLVLMPDTQNYSASATNIRSGLLGLGGERKKEEA